MTTTDRDVQAALDSLGGSLVGFTGLGSPSLGIFEGLLARWADDAPNLAGDIGAWAKYRLGEEFWSAQREIAHSVTQNRYTAVHSAHDMGKSYLASRVAAWWIDTHPPGEAFVVSTAPTAAQVSAILWREIAKAHRKGGLPGKINRAGYPQWYTGSELVGYGRKPADYEESAFQGIHAKYVLVIIDEACGVAKHLYDAVDALVTNTYSRVLAIGNPDIPGSHFQAVTRPDSGWSVLHLDALRSPNMTYSQVVGEDAQHPTYPLLAALMEVEGIPFSTEQVSDSLRDLLVSPIWVEERLRRWGGMSGVNADDMDVFDLGDMVAQRAAKSALITSKVRGLFPTSTADGVIPLGWVQLAVNRWHDLFDRPARYVDGQVTKLKAVSELAVDPGHLVLGVDVARTGEDETALAIRYGNILEKVERFRIADTMETADYVSGRMTEPGSVAVVDVVGIGAGVFDALRRMRKDGTILGRSVAFNAAANSDRRDKLGQFKFRNDRAAAWWRLRELLDPSRGSNIALPDDERLIEELVAPGYSLLAGGVIQIESKDDIRKKIGRSTDSADAVVQAFWVSGQPADVAVTEYPKPKRRDPRQPKPDPVPGDFLGNPAPRGYFDAAEFGFEDGASLSPSGGWGDGELDPDFRPW